MKIGMLMYQIQDLGGIVSNTEWLVAGLKELGHDVDLLQLVWKKDAPSQRSAITPQHYKGHCGMWVSQQSGWIFPSHNRIAYKGYRLKYAKARLAEYDLLVWTIATPSKAKDMKGNMDWLELYDLPATTKQVAYLHDGNLEKLSAHVAFIEPHMESVGCVHPCCHNAAKRVLMKPSSLIYSSQPPWPDRDSLPSWESRNKGFLACQVFKAWKHVHELVRAIPFMPEDIAKHVGGRGIEQRYLSSVDKCKPKYYFGPEHPGHTGRRYWEVALEYGMQYHGWMKPEQRNAILQSVRCQVDPSWSKSYILRGEHFNRTSVEAHAHGCIPIAHPGAIDSDDPNCLWKPMENYYPIPIFAEDGDPISPEDYAAHIEAACNLDPREAKRMLDNGRSLEQEFLFTNVAQRCLDLMHPETEANEHLDKDARIQFMNRAHKIMEHFREE